MNSTRSDADDAPEIGRFVDSTPLLDAPDLLRGRAMDDGYLFFRGLLPESPVMIVRQQVLEVLRDHGWMHPEQSPTGGRMDVDAINTVPEDQLRADIGISQDAYVDVQRIEAMHRLPHHPNLLQLYETLFQSEVFVHPRHIMRVMTPHHGLSPTPPHQDFPLVQGTSNTWTCWFPLGDCPTSLGSLSALRGSHHNGYVPIRPAAGAGLIAAQLCRDETDWLSEDFRAGDVLTFPSFTIHRALKSSVPDEVRISLDVRYQPAGEPIEEKSLRNHSSAPWDDIYQNWQSDDLKYYWTGNAMPLSPWDDSLLQPGRRIC